MSAEVVSELAWKDMEYFKRGGHGGLSRKECVSRAKASMLDYSVELEYRYAEGVCVGGGR